MPLTLTKATLYTYTPHNTVRLSVSDLPGVTVPANFTKTKSKKKPTPVAKPDVAAKLKISSASVPA